MQNTNLVHKGRLKNGKNCLIHYSFFKRNSHQYFWNPIPATLFKIGKPDPKSSLVSLGDIKKVYHQNNYVNQILHTVKQVKMVSTQIEVIIKKKDIDSMIEQMEDLNICKDKEKPKPQLLGDIIKP